ncbi:16S rRNA (guanine(527)-N(7))-methyltransferase RsmG, partial [Borreliella americana]|nr:16S rRNA (guanine(527)-N(7))-methyltransferase RsmG [Borreliella americana]
MISDIEFAFSEYNFQFAYKDLQKINLYIKR